MADKRIESLKALRKAILAAVASADIDVDTAAAIAPALDAWVAGAKYKKGALATYGTGVYRCVANVNNSDAAPDADAEHWARVDVTEDGVEVWSASAAYQKGDRVHYPDNDGPVYVSQKNNNYTEPGTDEKYWTVEA